ncbi:hypothetical protein ACU18_19105, partial [Arthrobacter sp. ZBG10]
ATVILASAAVVMAGTVALHPVLAELLPGSTDAAEAAPIPAVAGELHVTAAGDYSSSTAAADVLARVG